MGTVDGLRRRKRTHSKPPATVSRPADFYFPHRPNHTSQENRTKNHPLFYILLLLIISFMTFLAIDSTLNYKRNLESGSRKIESNISSGIASLSSNNFEDALSNFNQANDDLTALKIKLQETGQYINYLFYLPQSDSKLNEASRIINALSSLTETVTVLSQGINQISSPKLENGDQIKLISDNSQQLSTVAKNDLPKLIDSAEKLKQANSILSSSTSSNYRNTRELILNKLPEIQKLVDSTIELYKIIPEIFAINGQKKYLILFQNNSELRPAGGFLGSFAVADFQNSALKSLDFQTNIYKIDKPYMVKNPIKDPPEYLYVSPAVAMRDSNWNYDFSLAMQKTLWYYHEETADTAKGVIAMDTTLITELLKIIGPIDLPDYKLSINADNFLTEIEYQVEIGYFKNQTNWGENAPKKILSEMMPKLISKTFQGLADNKKRGQIIALINSSLNGKHLLFYSDDKQVQEYFEKKNYAGRVQDFPADYLFLSSSNIGGKKSSLNIKEEINQKLDFDANGNATKTVTVNRQHLGSNNWPDGENKTYNKLIVPLGSKIIQYQVKSGNDIPYSDPANAAKAGMKSYDESGKTIFAFWQNTKVGESSQIVIKYQLPDTLKFSADYQLLIQKQPGTVGSEQKIEINNSSHQVYLGDQKLSDPITFTLSQDSLIKLNFKD